MSAVPQQMQTKHQNIKMRQIKELKHALNKMAAIRKYVRTVL